MENNTDSNSPLPSKPTDNSNQTIGQAEQMASRAFAPDTKLPDYAAIDPNRKLPPHKRFAAWHRALGKKQKFALLFAAFVLLGGGCAAAYTILKNDPAPVSQPSIAIQKPDTVASLLTGLQVKPEINQKQVTAVMIENSVDARPQAGLRDAGLIYEAVAEGGITRLIALFQDTESKYIGPVRSVRPYYLDFAAPYDAAIAHVGGSPKALSQIKNEGLKDLDQFYNAGAYERVSNRAAPHNVYTSSSKLAQIEKSKGFKKSSYKGFPRAKKEIKPGAVTAKTISMKLSGPLFDVKYAFDAKSNTYKRFVGGEKHLDEKSGKQLAPKVVVAVVMNRTNDGIYSVYQTTGSGSVYVFQAGKVVKGTWSKKSRTSQLILLDSNKKPIELNPGKTWVTIVSEAGAVSYKK